VSTVPSRLYNIAMWDVLLAIVCLLIMLVGLIGVVVPLLPGIPLAWVGLFIYALVTGFEKISILTTVVFFIVMLLALGLDFLAPMLGARKYQASKWGVLGAFIGFTVGIFVVPGWGIILGPFIGALLGELIVKRQLSQAFRSALGAFIGFIAGTLFKIIIILIMIGFLIVSLF